MDYAICSFGKEPSWFPSKLMHYRGHALRPHALCVTALGVAHNHAELHTWWIVEGHSAITLETYTNPHRRKSIRLRDSDSNNIPVTTVVTRVAYTVNYIVTITVDNDVIDRVKCTLSGCDPVTLSGARISHDILHHIALYLGIRSFLHNNGCLHHDGAMSDFSCSANNPYIDKCDKSGWSELDWHQQIELQL